jgi:hypothetical protein
MIKIFHMTKTAILYSIILAVAISISGPASAQELDHREDYRMNSVSGGNFRDYVTENIDEEDLWARSMQKLGTFHNLMHEMMSDLARYGEMNGKGDLVPDFGVRISGGDWGQYRKNKEEAGIESEWHDFVRITEIMHDRVHHVMYNTLVYDNESRDRGLDMDDYTGGRPVYPADQVFPEPQEVNVTIISPDDFREFVWHTNFEDFHLHSALQKMQVFSEMMYDLMDLWARYAGQLDQEACSPPDYDGQVTGAEWDRYSSRIMMCNDDNWRDLVRSVNLMHDRISHMNYMIVRYLDSKEILAGDLR